MSQFTSAYVLGTIKSGVDRENPNKNVGDIMGNNLDETLRKEFATLTEEEKEFIIQALTPDQIA